MSSFNEWFTALPEGRQKVLREDKWMLAEAAFEAGKKIGPFKKRKQPDTRTLDFTKNQGLRRGDKTPKCIFATLFGGRVLGKHWPWVDSYSWTVHQGQERHSVTFTKIQPPRT